MQVTLCRDELDLLERVRALGAAGMTQSEIAFELGFNSLGGLRERLRQIGFEFMSTNDLRAVTGKTPFREIQISVNAAEDREPEGAAA